MSIEEKLEIAKQYISNNKLTEALDLLNPLLRIKSDDNFKQNVYFELGKVYIIMGDNKKSIKFFSKIKKDNGLYNLAVDMLLKNYRMLNLSIEQIRLLKKNKNFLKRKEIVDDVICYVIENKLFLTGFKFINGYKDEIVNFNELLNKLCEHSVLYIQHLNKTHKYNDVKQFFKTINKYIPKTKVKLKNILLNEYELAQGKICLKSYPRIMNLVLTTKCNLKCIMCREIEHDSKYNLSDEELKHLIEIMPYLEKLILRGGEVFLYKKIVYILEQAKKYNVDVEIVTNGLLLTEKIINLLLDVVTELTFSVDAIDKSIYEKIRVGSNYERLLQNIELFNNLNKKRNHKINTRLTMVVMKSNYKEIESVIKFASKYNFKEVYLLPIRGVRAEQSELIFSYGFNENIIKWLNDKKEFFDNIAKKYSIKLYNTLPMIDSNNIKSMNRIADIPINKENISDNYETLENYSCIKEKQMEIKNNNLPKFCHAPWKQIFLFENICLPTCFCKPYVSNINNNKKNFIIDDWNNDVMKTYRYKIVNNEYKNFCSKDCLSNDSEYMKIL